MDFSIAFDKVFHVTRKNKPSNFEIRSTTHCCIDRVLYSIRKRIRIKGLNS